MANVLIAEPDPGASSLLELLVLRLGHRAVAQESLAEIEDLDLLLVEPSSRPGLRLAQDLRRRLPALPIVCVSIQPPSAETEALGAVGHVMKPFRRTQLERAIQGALVKRAA